MYCHRSTYCQNSTIKSTLQSPGGFTIQNLGCHHDDPLVIDRAVPEDRSIHMNAVPTLDELRFRLRMASVSGESNTQSLHRTVSWFTHHLGPPTINLT